MKNYSDYFSCFKGFASKVSNRVATTALFMVAAITMGFAQEYDVSFIEGSVHSFNVENHEGNSFVWAMHTATFAEMDPLAYTFIEGQFETNVTVKFNDMGRGVRELVYLAVTESRPEGCSTTRALRIMLEPNNMYFEFAEEISTDCFNPADPNYQASVNVGLDFNDKISGTPIPEEYFPLQVSYQIRNLTAGTSFVDGNGGNPLVVAYNADNNYSLLITEAVGQRDQSTDYELVITTVTDKYQTVITPNPGDNRTQRRIIIHLPQSGTMDMALAYLSDIEYQGSR